MDEVQKVREKAEKNNLRLIVAGNRIGMFHCWEQLRVGQYGWMQAVVEHADGTVVKYKTCDIAFID